MAVPLWMPFAPIQAGPASVRSWFTWSGWTRFTPASAATRCDSVAVSCTAIPLYAAR